MITIEQIKELMAKSTPKPWNIYIDADILLAELKKMEE